MTTAAKGRKEKENAAFRKWLQDGLDAFPKWTDDERNQVHKILGSASRLLQVIPDPPKSPRGEELRSEFPFKILRQGGAGEVEPHLSGNVFRYAWTAAQVELAQSALRSGFGLAIYCPQDLAVTQALIVGWTLKCKVLGKYNSEHGALLIWDIDRSREDIETIHYERELYEVEA